MEHYIKNMLKYIDHFNGFFIECGANDGITQSYTYELEKRGWNGILIEPSLNAFNRCIVNRSNNNKFYNCALVSSEEISEIYGDFDGNLMSSVSGKNMNRQLNIKVKSRTLNSILEELDIKNIDLFSLDVEGYELDVLKGVNFNIYNIKYIIIEIRENINKCDILNLMSNNNYELLECLTNYNKKDYPSWGGNNDYIFIKK